MTSFANTVLLMEENCYKFTLKYETQNYYGQFTKHLSSVKYITHRDGNA